MARFFSTSDAPYVDDGMFQLPADLMLKAVQAKDEIVNKRIDETIDIRQYLPIDALDPDKERGNARVAEFEGEIDNLLNTILTKPEENYKLAVSSLERKVYDDYSKGHIAKINANKKTYAAWYDELQKQREKNPEKYHPLKVEALVNAKMQEYAGGGGYHQEQTGFRDFSTENMLGTKPYIEHIEAAFKDKLGKVTGTKYDSETGEYRIVTENKLEGWTQEEIMNQLNSYYNATPDLQYAMMQDMGLGLLDPTENPLTNLYNHAIQTYGKRNIYHAQQTELSHEGKLKMGKKYEESSLDMPIVETGIMLTNELVNYSTYEEAEKALATIMNAPGTYYRTIVDKAIKMGADPEVTFEEAVATIYSDGDSQQKVLDEYAALRQQGYFANSRERFLAESKKAGKSYIDVKGTAYKEAEAFSSFTGTGATKADIAALQAQVKGNAFKLPLSDLHTLSYKVTDNSGVPVYIQTPSTPGKTRFKEGEFIATYTNSQGYTITLKVDPTKMGMNGSIDEENMGLAIKKLEATAKARGQEAKPGTMRLAKAVVFNSDVVTPQDIARKGIPVYSTSSDSQEVSTVDELSGNVTTFSKKEGAMSKNGIVLDHTTYMPSTQTNSKGQQGFNITATVGKNAEAVSMFATKDNGVSNSNVNNWFNANAESMRFNKNLNNSATITDDGRVIGLVTPGRVISYETTNQYTGQKEVVSGNFEITKYGTVWFQGKQVTAPGDIKALIQIRASQGN